MAARTWLLASGAALLLGPLAYGCVPETFTFEGPQSGSSSGGGVGGGVVCGPQMTQPCYTGPMGTLSIGECKAGAMACDAGGSGSGAGACEGQVLPSFEDCATPLDEDCDGASPPCTGSHIWSARWGDDRVQYASSIAVDAEGNTVVVGAFAGDLGVGTPANAGDLDAFAVKLDPAGKVVWARSWGDAADQRAYGVAIDPTGSVFIVGAFGGELDFGVGVLVSLGADDVFVAKLSSAGDAVWSKAYGDVGTQAAYAVDVDGAGHLVIGGEFTGTLDFGAGQTLTGAGMANGFVAMLDAATGGVVWGKGFGDAGSQACSRVKLGSGGSVIMTGYGDGTVDFGDGPRKSAGNLDSYLVKFGAKGGVVWSKVLGGPADDRGIEVAIDGEDNVMAAGSFGGAVDFGGGTLTAAGTSDMYLVKYGAGGSFVWGNRYGTGTTTPSGVATDAAGNIVLIGFLTGDIDFGDGNLPGNMDLDAFVAKLDKGGKALWSMNIGAKGGMERGIDVAVSSLGEALLTGYFSAMLALPGGVTLTSAGDQDVFVAKLLP